MTDLSNTLAAPQAVATAVAAGTGLPQALQRRAGWRAPLAVLAILAFVSVGPWLSVFQLTLLNQIGLAALVVLGLVLLTGVAGMTSFGQAAFVGIGAYACAWLTLGQGLPAWLAPLAGSHWAALGLGLVVTLGVSLALGAVTLKLSGHYLPLGTICWGLALYALFGTSEALGTHTGLSGLPPLQLLGWRLDQPGQMFVLIWALLFVTMLGVHCLLDSRTGRAIRALNGGQAMAASMGVPVLRMKMAAFTLSALLACLSGWLYACNQRFVSPAPFSLGAGIDYLFMALIGGVGQLWGAIAGAAVVTLARDALQDQLPRLLGRSGNYEAIVFALCVVLLMQRAPGGLWAAVRRWRLARRQAARGAAGAQGTAQADGRATGHGTEAGEMASVAAAAAAAAVAPPRAVAGGRPALPAAP
ncbi:branched-chain amino acid ABC transporter permease [Aquabacterium sp. OR-4]|uniref:branched-chain amino acid ABC transporter permease n=1 Tax=Aquabacterium sp. OR-4 TaxID=2978127 RepID=UPI0028C81826|nr:branched-chain amino acid ABC transporter permease [Aquabacterium sp. OR-4]MDT7839025.1 branched-chain amino acid ABC transporter permease [Aquabacterium sp. OR-4]